jgi:hypothetical protein
MKRGLFGLALLTGLLAAVLPMQAASAAGRPSCLVSNERTDLGSRSLQAGIDASAPGDTLVVKGTCVGTSEIAKDLTLKGVSNAPFGVATIDGDALGSVLTISGVVTVGIESLIITHGSAANGGGISNTGSALTLTNATVRDNASSQEGGGIFNSSGGTLTLNNSTVSENAAGFSGGGVFSQNGSTVVLNNSTVSENTAGFGGGGVFSFNGGGGTVTLNNSTVSGNTAAGGGGGISFIFNTLTLNDSTLTGNTAGENGGGVLDGAGTLVLSGASTVNGNTASLNGGGIYNSGGTLVNCISGVNVTGNTPNNIFP